MIWMFPFISASVKSGLIALPFCIRLEPEWKYSPSRLQLSYAPSPPHCIFSEPNPEVHIWVNIQRIGDKILCASIDSLETFWFIVLVETKSGRGLRSQEKKKANELKLEAGLSPRGLSPPRGTSLDPARYFFGLT